MKRGEFQIAQTYFVKVLETIPLPDKEKEQGKLFYCHIAIRSAMDAQLMAGVDLL